MRSAGETGGPLRFRRPVRLPEGGRTLVLCSVVYIGLGVGEWFSDAVTVVVEVVAGGIMDRPASPRPSGVACGVGVELGAFWVADPGGRSPCLGLSPSGEASVQRRRPTRPWMLELRALFWGVACGGFRAFEAPVGAMMKEQLPVSWGDGGPDLVFAWLFLGETPFSPLVPCPSELLLPLLRAASPLRNPAEPRVDPWPMCWNPIPVLVRWDGTLLRYSKPFEAKAFAGFGRLSAAVLHRRVPLGEGWWLRGGHAAVVEDDLAGLRCIFLFVQGFSAKFSSCVWSIVRVWCACMCWSSVCCLEL